jgi:hypothetical protein
MNRRYNCSSCGSYKFGDLRLQHWVLMIRFLPKSLSTSTTFVEVNESRPVVGSSKNIKFGSVISSTPMEHLFLSPPETPLTRGPPIFVFWAFSSLRFSRSSSTLFLSIYFGWEPHIRCELKSLSNRHGLHKDIILRSHLKTYTCWT